MNPSVLTLEMLRNALLLMLDKSGTVFSRNGVSSKAIASVKARLESVAPLSSQIVSECACVNCFDKALNAHLLPALLTKEEDVLIGYGTSHDGSLRASHLRKLLPSDTGYEHRERVTSEVLAASAERMQSLIECSNHPLKRKLRPEPMTLAKLIPRLTNKFVFADIATLETIRGALKTSIGLPYMACVGSSIYSFELPNAKDGSAPCMALMRLNSMRIMYELEELQTAYLKPHTALPDKYTSYLYGHS